MLVLALVIGGCSERSERSDEPAPEPRRGGKIIVGVDAEPAILNPYLAAGSLAINAFISDKVVAGAWRISPDFAYSPGLISDEPAVTNDPFTVTYSIRPDATWSDGVPVSARDMEFTWQTVVNPDWQIAVREGYEKITGAEILDAKTVRFTFSEPYGHWRLLFLRGGILPAHRLAGQNFNDVWKDGFDVASGPFMFREWVKGDHLTLVPNPSYFREQPHIDELEIRFVPDSNTRFQQFRSGDLEVFEPRGANVELVRDMNQVSLTAGRGSGVMYLGFNAADPLLGDLRVRRAIAHAIDRKALVKAVFGREYPPIEPLNSLVYAGTQPEYREPFGRYSHDPGLAARLLDEAGCRRDGGELRRCGQRTLTFTVLVRSDDEQTRLLFEIMQAQLKESGVGVTADYGKLDVIFGKAMSGNFELVLEGVSGAPEPVLADLTWTCNGPFNFRGFCNQTTTMLLRDAARALDRDSAAALYNRADAALVDDLPALPLVQVPLTLAWRKTVHGPTINPAFPSPFWNAEEWFVSR